jgi:hypothetical protein
MKMWDTLLVTTQWMISAYHQNWMEPLVCPLLNIVVDIKTSEKSDSRKMTQQRMQAGNKMQVPKETSRYHQEDFSFKGGSHPDT